jgi:hypothetical protein
LKKYFIPVLRNTTSTVATNQTTHGRPKDTTPAKPFLLSSNAGKTLPYLFQPHHSHIFFHRKEKGFHLDKETPLQTLAQKPLPPATTFEEDAPDAPPHIAHIVAGIGDLSRNEPPKNHQR